MQDQHVRVGEQRPRQRPALPLTAGQAGAALDDRVRRARRGAVRRRRWRTTPPSAARPCGIGVGGAPATARFDSSVPLNRSPMWCSTSRQVRRSPGGARRCGGRRRVRACVGDLTYPDSRSIKRRRRRARRTSAPRRTRPAGRRGPTRRGPRATSVADRQTSRVDPCGTGSAVSSTVGGSGEASTLAIRLADAARFGDPLGTIGQQRERLDEELGQDRSR